MTGIMEVYGRMLEAYGKQGWWPSGRGLRPRGWEICVGAILTQNTSWNNVEKAISNIADSGCLTSEDMESVGKERLAMLIRPSGYFNQKAERLKNFASFVLGFGSFEGFKDSVTREQLLDMKGIGPETADSILLYACGRAEFVADAYTKRVFERLGLLGGRASYYEIKGFFESELPKDQRLFNECHALIVMHAKSVCRKKPLCGECCLKNICPYPNKKV